MLIVGDGEPLCRECISDAVVHAELVEANAVIERMRKTYAWRLMHGDQGGRTT